MTLQLATIDQLVEWQSAIVFELARRAVAASAPAPVAAPPWQAIAVGPSPVPYAPVVAQQPQAAAPVLPKPAAAPSMLRPGTVIATDRTDPKLAALFAATPPRYEGVPGVQGRGQGEGMVEFNVPGGPT